MASSPDITINLPILFSFIMIVSANGLVNAQQIPVTYPRVAGYISYVNPIISIDKKATTFNFRHDYTGGFPCGLNLLKSDRSGFSFEVTPFIKSTNGSVKVSAWLFHPGVMFRYPRGFTFVARMAFETTGRFGFTAVFNKVIIRAKNNNYFIAVPVPFRFGNDKPASVGTAIQMGVSF